MQKILVNIPQWNDDKKKFEYNRWIEGFFGTSQPLVGQDSGSVLYFCLFFCLMSQSTIFQSCMLGQFPVFLG